MTNECSAQSNEGSQGAQQMSTEKEHGCLHWVVDIALGVQTPSVLGLFVNPGHAFKDLSGCFGAQKIVSQISTGTSGVINMAIQTGC